MGCTLSFAFLKQPRSPPDSRLCAFYALYHFTDGGLTRQGFIDTATDHYVAALGLPREEATALVMDGNDPSVLALYGLREGSLASLESKGLGVVADTHRGHFFTVRREEGVWFSHDSYHHDAPRAYDSFQALVRAEIGDAPVWL